MINAITLTNATHEMILECGHDFMLVKLKEQSRSDVRNSKYSFSQIITNAWNESSTVCVHASSR